MIIGNGFDISCGLPTRYSDFITFLKEWENFYSSIKNLKTSNNYTPKKTKSDLIAYFLKHCNTIEATIIEECNNIIISNKWIKCFFLENSNQLNNNWIDFEREIQNIIELIENAFSSIYKYYTTEFDKKVAAFTISDAIKYINIFDSKKYIFTLQNDQWIVSSKYSLRDILLYKENLLNTMVEELENFNKCFYLYLKHFVNTYPVINHSNLDNLVKTDFSNILTFNYTNNIEEALGNKYDDSFCHVHGSLEENNIVMGIGDHSIGNNEYLYFQKFFQRIQKHADYSYTKWLDYETQYNIIIYGHSLDATDKSIFEYFFKHTNVNKIKIYDSIKYFV